eukprot:scaffold14476_cov120-Isochrysis_galbana.AAC.2
MACVSTVAVVVPSPARESVCDAACRSSLTPTFSLIDSKSTCPAMVTPSLTTDIAFPLGAITTLRPFGPSVTLTAFATLSTPLTKCRRASCPKSMLRAIISTCSCAGAGRKPTPMCRPCEPAAHKSASIGATAVRSDRATMARRGEARDSHHTVRGERGTVRVGAPLPLPLLSGGACLGFSGYVISTTTASGPRAGVGGAVGLHLEYIPLPV